MTIRELVVDVIALQLGVDPSRVVPDAVIMSAFDADSIDVIDIVITLEEALGIEIPVENLDFAETPQTLYDYLAKRGFPQDAEAPTTAKR